MQTINSIDKRKMIVVVLLFLGGPLFMMLTNPEQLPIMFMVVPFLWLFVTLYIGIHFLVRKLWPDAPSRRGFIIAGVGAALPVLLSVFASLHQLTLRDVLLSVAIVACVALYMAKADFIR